MLGVEVVIFGVCDISLIKDYSGLGSMELLSGRCQGRCCEGITLKGTGISMILYAIIFQAIGMYSRT